MMLLYPSFLWLLIPLGLFLSKNNLIFMHRIHLIILMLIVLSLSRPVQEQSLQEVNIEAKDIIIALDVSYSMKATDISPTRYDFAKETISAFLKNNPTDNIMLIVFTSNPLLLSPPTTDHTLINVALQSLNPEFILTKGTSLKKLFRKLTSMKIHHKNLILITDGGEENNLEQLTTLIKNANLSLTVLALGTQQGTPIKNKEGKLLKDAEGNLVITRLNPLLESLSSSVSGSYFRASHSARSTANKLTVALKIEKDQTQLVKKQQRNYLELYQIPLSLALVLFFMLHTRLRKYLLLKELKIFNK